jgi:electron-transferring-flavoprotein dehydrogenase
MTETHAYDVVVVGGGTAGAFAAATAAQEGADAVIVERKSAEDAGHIACGDAIKGKATFPDVIDRDYLREESFSNERITGARFENPETGEELDIPFSQPGAVLDRKRYGEVLLEEAERVGADVHFDTVVQDVIQAESDGQAPVEGVRAVRKGDPVEYRASMTVDAAGALSILQDEARLDGATFDTNVTYQQFCSAYREVVDVTEPVDWDDRIVFKPTQELGYLWYFPRTATEINAGLGFQMNKEPMELVEVLKRDLRTRPEFDGAEVRDKLGAALPTRRPYDSAVAPGFVAVGDAAGHVNPTTGGGIPGAAKAGTWAARRAVESLNGSPPDEDDMWEYNRQVMTDFGRRFAAMDVYNIWAGAHDVDELVSIVTALPGQQLVDVLGSKGSTSMGLLLKLKTLFDTFGHWGTLNELRKIKRRADRLKDHYADYPDSPDGFGRWQQERDRIMAEIYEISGADPKY